jgi:hypothetical protein
MVRDVAVAERASFDFAVISDHYFPWLEAQGHSHTLAACLARPARPPQLPPVGRRQPDIGTRNVRAMPCQSREQSATAD